MNITMPVDMEVELSPGEIVRYVEDWIYPILKKYEKEGSDSITSTAVLIKDKLYWEYSPYGWELQRKEIKIKDPVIFEMCKGGVMLINSYMKT